MAEPTQQPLDQPTHHAAINALAEHLARTTPTQQLTPQARINAIHAVTATTEPGAFDQLLVATPNITSPVTYGGYVGALRDLTAVNT